MKLRSLTLDNFRQFHGEQIPIRFSPSGDKNITLIYGANGAGKTTILNAFTWVLYNETTPALSNPEHLISEKALLEASDGELVEGSVSIEFEHEGEKYIATRSRRRRKTGAGIRGVLAEEGELSLQIIDETGKTRRPMNPNDVLERVLPKHLYNFFFFDGERIERLTKDSTYDEVGDAIKNLLGLELLERSKRHLGGKVKRELDKKLSDVGTVETRELVEEIQELEDQLDRKKDKLIDEKRNKSEIEKDIDEVKSRLRNLKESQKIQEKIDGLERRESQLQSTLQDLEEKTHNLLSKTGFTAFLDPVVENCFEILEEKRKKGEIPSGIKKQFVEDLLEMGECICGAPLEEGTDHYQAVEAWLERAGMSDVEEAATKVGVQLKSFRESRQEFFDKLDDYQRRRSIARRRREQTREEISEEKRKLSDKDSETVKELSARRDELEETHEQIVLRIGRIDQTIERIEDELEDLEEKKEEAAAQNAKEELIQRRLKVVREAVEFFEELYNYRSEQVRQVIDDRIKDVYQKISYKDYWPEITKDYKLVLKKGMRTDEEVLDRDVARSTGENQILSLSFIGSISDYARERYRADDPGGLGGDLGFKGGIYPVVMDSPFGALDSNYREAVAQGVPELADQITIIVSKSQGLGVVQETIKGRIDRTYVLSYHTPKDDAGEEVINIGGAKVPYISRSKNEDEWAEIIEVE